MRCRGLGYWSIWMAATGLFMALAPSVVWAQATAGVAIDADGVLRTRTFIDPGGQLIQERIASAKATLDPKLASYSKLRKVSLNRLEQVILGRQGVLTDEMRYMAGLLRVRYVFYYPDSKDIVLAGPAEGWAPDLSGRVVGITSGRPVIQLQDLAVALRMFPPDGKPTEMIGCSIDPTQQGLASMQHFVRTNRHFAIANPQGFAEALRNSLGFQIVTIIGAPPKTHFAQVMVEADYRMKLIGIGLERPPVKLVSYVDRVKLADVARNAMQRWYFVPDYKCIRQSDDGLAMELVGDGVKLIGADEMVTGSGERKAAGRGNRASQAFVLGFTKKYPELAERSPVYAELRNLIDLAVAAAYIQEQDYYHKAGWDMPFLGSEKAFPVEVYDVPKTVESAVNTIGKGNTLGFPVGGGVQIHPAEALDSENILPDKKAKVAKLHQEIKPDLADGQWWWD